MKFLAAGLLILLVLLQYRLWFGDGSVREVARLQAEITAQEAAERAPARAQPHARGRSAGPEEGHDGDRGAGAHGSRHGRQERNVLPGRVARGLRRRASRAQLPASGEGRRGQSMTAILGRSCRRRAARGAWPAQACRSSTCRSRAAPSSNGRSRPSWNVPTASASSSCSPRTIVVGASSRSRSDPTDPDRDRRRRACRLGACGSARAGCACQSRTTGCWCTTLRDRACEPRILSRLIDELADDGVGGLLGAPVVDTSEARRR